MSLSAILFNAPIHILTIIVLVLVIIDFVKKPAIVVDVASLDEEEEPEDEHALQVISLS